jgi:hypothetical protein
MPRTFFGLPLSARREVDDRELRLREPLRDGRRASPIRKPIAIDEVVALACAGRQVGNVSAAVFEMKTRPVTPNRFFASFRPFARGR